MERPQGLKLKTLDHLVDMTNRNHLWSMYDWNPPRTISSLFPDQHWTSYGNNAQATLDQIHMGRGNGVDLRYADPNIYPHIDWLSSFSRSTAIHSTYENAIQNIHTSPVDLSIKDKHCAASCTCSNPVQPSNPTSQGNNRVQTDREWIENLARTIYSRTVGPEANRGYEHASRDKRGPASSTSSRPLKRSHPSSHDSDAMIMLDRICMGLNSVNHPHPTHTNVIQSVLPQADMGSSSVKRSRPKPRASTGNRSKKNKGGPASGTYSRLLKRSAPTSNDNDTPTTLNGQDTGSSFVNSTGPTFHMACDNGPTSHVNDTRTIVDRIDMAPNSVKRKRPMSHVNNSQGVLDSSSVNPLGPSTSMRHRLFLNKRVPRILRYSNYTQTILERTDPHISNTLIITYPPDLTSPLTCDEGSISSINDIQTILDQTDSSGPTSHVNDTETILDRTDPSSPTLHINDSQTIPDRNDPSGHISHGNETQTVFDRLESSDPASHVNDTETILHRKDPSGHISHGNDTQTILDRLESSGPTSHVNNTETILDQTDPSGPPSHVNDTETILDRTDFLGSTSHGNDTQTLLDRKDPSRHISHGNDTQTFLDRTDSSGHTLHINDTETILDRTESLSPTLRVNDAETILDRPETSGPTSHINDTEKILDRTESSSPTLRVNDAETILDRPEPSGPTSHINDTETILDRTESSSPTLRVNDAETILDRTEPSSPTSHINDTETILDRTESSSPTLRVNDAETILDRTEPSSPTSHINDTETILDRTESSNLTLRVNNTETILDQLEPSGPRSHVNDTPTILDRTDSSGHISHDNDTQTIFNRLEPSGPTSHVNDTRTILDRTESSSPTLRINDAETILDRLEPSGPTQVNDTQTIVDGMDLSGSTSIDHGSILVKPSQSASYGRNAQTIFDRMEMGSDFEEFSDGDDREEYYCGIDSNNTRQNVCNLLEAEVLEISDDEESLAEATATTEPASDEVVAIVGRESVSPISDVDYDPASPSGTEEDVDREYVSPVTDVDTESASPVADVVSPVAEVDYEPASPVSDVNRESSSPVADVDNVPASPVSDVNRESSSPVADVDNEPASPVSDVNRESTSPVSDVDRESASPVADVDRESASPVADDIEECMSSEGETAKSYDETQVAANRVSMDADLNTFTWSDDFSKFRGRHEVYSKCPGPQLKVGSPTDLFLHVWDLPFVTHIVEETNRHAARTISRLSEVNSISGNVETWCDTNVAEIYQLFVIFIYMSICYRSTIDDYWATGCLGMPEFKALMSQNRFQNLSKFLHFVDNDTIEDGPYKQNIAKIEPVVTHCNEKFSSMYVPEQVLNLDETLLLWKDHMFWVQCIQGIKSYEICEASSGYMLRSLLYTGKNISSYGTVLDLLDGYLDVGHTLVMDNWYNQLPLTRYLKKERRTDVIGTINRRVFQVPNAIKTIVDNEVQRGDQIARNSGDITIIAWKDKEIVTAISTFHNDYKNRCKRKDSEIPKPELFEYYYKNNEGLHSKDKLMSQYLMDYTKNTTKWYIKVFKRLLNISLFNTYVIYSKSPSEGVLSHHQFRYKVAEGVLMNVSKSKISAPLSLPPSSIKRLNSTRMHFPRQTETDPRTERLKKRLCARCSAKGIRTEVTTICGECNVGLCFGQCWIDYHTLKDL